MSTTATRTTRRSSEALFMDLRLSCYHAVYSYCYVIMIDASSGLFLHRRLSLKPFDTVLCFVMLQRAERKEWKNVRSMPNRVSLSKCAEFKGHEHTTTKKCNEMLFSSHFLLSSALCRYHHQLGILPPPSLLVRPASHTSLSDNPSRLDFEPALQSSGLHVQGIHSILDPRSQIRAFHLLPPTASAASNPLFFAAKHSPPTAPQHVLHRRFQPARRRGRQPRQG